MLKLQTQYKHLELYPNWRAGSLHREEKNNSVDIINGYICVLSTVGGF